MEWYNWLFLGLGVSILLTVICVIYDGSLKEYARDMFHEVAKPIGQILMLIFGMIFGWMFFAQQEISEWLWLRKQKEQKQAKANPTPPS